MPRCPRSQTRMRLAILSDIHSNYFALRRVVDHAKTQNVDGYLILGDIVGYLGMPFETIGQIVEIGSNSRAHDLVVGNHDLIAAGEASLRMQLPLASAEARWSLAWLKRQAALDKNKARFDQFRKMINRHPTFKASELCGGLWLMHGISVEGEDQYNREKSPNVFGYDSYVRDDTWEDMDRLDRSYQFSLAQAAGSEVKPRIMIGGHSHRAMLWHRSGQGVWTQQPLPESANRERQPWRQCPRCSGDGSCRRWNAMEPIPLGPVGDPVYINPGSVGQPRDGCPAAAMAILDCEENTVQFCRLDYDYRAAHDDLFKMVNSEADDKTIEREVAWAERLASCLETGEFRR
jgi:predicted phosphodiesterase